ncbi:MAG: molybdenum cofactor biosynthesis protein MoaE [Planctomycetota bacterium]|nr:molybdenum cofactor biosynthesis protein MoaE [Planctomycetota bacterium]
MTTERFRIVRDPIDAEVVRAAVAGPSCGAVVVFHGTVRNRTDDRVVEHLEYEAYEPMAIKQMQLLADAMLDTHAIAALACTHRIGPVPIGEDAMVVAVASPHRAAALAATGDFITRLKQDVPIWKKEHFEGGAIWLGTPDDPQGERARQAESTP